MKILPITGQMSWPNSRSMCKKVIITILAFSLINLLAASAAQQSDGAAAANQKKNVSEKSRSQREETKQKPTQEADKLMRRDGNSRHQHLSGASMVPPNLAAPELGDNEYLAEDGTDSSTSPFSAEYETEATELMDLPNLQPSNLRHPFGHQSNHRPLRNSNNAIMDQHHNQQPMMMMSTQQQPRMQQSASMGPVVSVVSSTMASTGSDSMQTSVGPQQQAPVASQNQMPGRFTNGFSQLLGQQQPANQVAAASSFSVKQQQPTSTTSASSPLGDRDVTTTTESAAHELLSRVASQINERRLELLYPSNKEDARHHHPQQQHQHSEQQLAREAQILQPVGICYSTLALLAAMLASAAVTVLLCCATHFAVKHLGRHQFDLIAKNNFFESASGSGYLTGTTADQNRQSKQPSGMLSVFNEGSDMRSLQQRLRDEHGCAFDNPYFRDEATGQWRNLNGQPLTAYQSHAAGSKDAPDQLNFIEHHISNLHNRQVTSSVKELSISGLTPNGSSAHTAHVVDLTCEEQRAKVMADPKEGDLVAVDITGHDFIGLGFDICGNPEDGIFIRSVLSRGPARESGCIQSGDKIKCLNISFDNITLQDACDILNCGSPYKLRLLLEKRAGSTSKLPEKRSSQPAPVVKRLPRADLAYRSQLLASSTGNVGRRTNSGPISATKSYIRRLASLMSMSSATSTAEQPSNVFCDQFGTQPPTLNSSDNQLLRPVYLGSAAARRRPSACSVVKQEAPATDDRLTVQNHNNSGRKSDSNEWYDEQPSTAQTSTSRRRMSHGDSFGSNLRAGRFSVESSDLLGRSSATEFGLDSSADFTSRNANHRLHGSHLFDGHSLRRQSSSQEITTRKSARNEATRAKERPTQDQEQQQ